MLDARREAVIVFGTTFRVMRGDQLLGQRGIAHGLAPTPAGIASPCGLCLRLEIDDVPEATVLFDEHDVVWQAAYRHNGETWTPIVERP